MGKSAKMYKRPSKSEKVARQINKQSAPAPRYERSISPEGPRTAIPLFNESRRTFVPTKPDPRLPKLADYDSMSQDSSLVGSPAETSDKVMEDEDADEPDLAMDKDEDTPAAVGKKRKSLKDKVRAAKEAIKEDELKSRGKLAGKKARKGNVLGNVDYVKLLEKRPGKKQFR
ncbi:hypothetical protein Rt10032_c14g5304 [Rhodotorula toruloides]|uniref:Uncharacterized protein n=1 Tax=Rhodotorula toruloides TaxID=5286 RepID=A0A511KLP8_RHOTO|nr:hypothetical protein Rt10032_c14g5304 [Rhodotorula toruloides]